MNTARWNTVKDFDLDKPLSEYGFSVRLARENFWTKNFTEKAILEYKKFMYLAATSDQMVSPSEIVDVVWHQHLVFTQSYNDFCAVLGKQIQHVPSTHNRDEREKFRAAKERTLKLYVSEFGTQPRDIWEYNGMFDSLNLEKATHKLRSKLIVAMLAFVLCALPAYFVFKLFLIFIPSSSFFIWVFTQIALSMIFLAAYTRPFLEKMIVSADASSFVWNLHPHELTYLKDRNLSDVAVNIVNRWVKEEKIVIGEDRKLSLNGSFEATSFEDHAMLDIMKLNPSISLKDLVGVLKTQAIVINNKNTIDALIKYVSKSKPFARMFFVNFGVLGFTMLICLERLVLGMNRHRPVVILVMFMIAFSVFVAIRLIRLARSSYKNDLLQRYRDKVRGSVRSLPLEWQYVFLGDAVVVTSLLPLVRHYQQGGGSSGDSGSSSCGSSCGSSCSSCGGCGGGGD